MAKTSSLLTLCRFFREKLKINKSNEPGKGCKSDHELDFGMKDVKISAIIQFLFIYLFATLLHIKYTSCTRTVTY